MKRTRSYVEFCYPPKYLGGTRNQDNYSVLADWPASSPLTPPNWTRTDLTKVEEAFSWRSANALDADGALYGGLYGTYDGSGYVFDLTNLTTSYLVDSFAFLKNNNWLDRKTRGLFVSMVVYNANFNLYAVVQFVLEVSPAGVLTPLYKMSTLEMDMYVLSHLEMTDYVRYTLEVSAS